MNIKTLLLVPGAIALSLACLSALPVTAQVNSAPTPNMERGWNRLNLSDAQKASMKQIREETKAQIDQVLNPTQRTQLQSLKQQGGKKSGGWKALNLSEQQKTEIKAIKERSKQRMQAVLTDAQRSQLQQQRQGMKQRRQQNQQQSGQSQ